MNRTSLLIATIILIVAVVVFAGLRAAAPHDEPAEVGRYQVEVTYNGGLVVLDTTTGQCWTRWPRQRWQAEGSPFDAADEEKDDEALSLDLPAETVQVTVRQRSSKAIPGSDDRIFIRIGDITEGQTLLLIETGDGDVILEEISLRQNDDATFRVGGQRYNLRVRELRNILIGDEDYGVFEISRKTVRDDEDEEDGATTDRGG